jgi:hypothetical protein
MKNKFTTKNSNSAPTNPTTSFTSTTTVANTPTPSPSKKVNKEVGSGTNVSSGRVKKTPAKGNGMAWAPKVKIRSRVGAENEDDGAVGSLVGGGGKWADEDYMGEV